MQLQLKSTMGGFRAAVHERLGRYEAALADYNLAIVHDPCAAISLNARCALDMIWSVSGALSPGLVLVSCQHACCITWHVWTET